MNISGNQDFCDIFHTMTTAPSPAPGRRPAASRGRPRDTERTEAILDAASELLLELGYDKFRIQDVADRAGSGTGAIYRRWKTKEDLVAEAVRTMEDPDIEETDDPVADLRALVTNKVMQFFANPDLVPGMITAMRTHPAIGDAVRERYSVELYRRQIARIIGDDNPHLDLLAELTPAIALNRASFAPGPLDGEALADQLIALIEAVA